MLCLSRPMMIKHCTSQTQTTKQIPHRPQPTTTPTTLLTTTTPTANQLRLHQRPHSQPQAMKVQRKQCRLDRHPFIWAATTTTTAEATRRPPTNPRRHAVPRRLPHVPPCVLPVNAHQRVNRHNNHLLSPRLLLPRLLLPRLLLNPINPAPLLRLHLPISINRYPKHRNNTKPPRHNNPLKPNRRMQLQPINNHLSNNVLNNNLLNVNLLNNLLNKVNNNNKNNHLNNNNNLNLNLNNKPPCHLSVLPLVWLLKQRNPPPVSHHCYQQLNFVRKPHVNWRHFNGGDRKPIVPLQKLNWHIKVLVVLLYDHLHWIVVWHCLMLMVVLVPLVILLFVTKTIRKQATVLKTT
mmetsp:Transcript_1047/g.1761  ORF Transcript_1047/g.1761 Transcript_1047/m.1761 type:complete len:349 (+) Transcript_1047:1811-2857(+)